MKNAILVLMFFCMSSVSFAAARCTVSENGKILIMVDNIQRLDPQQGEQEYSSADQTYKIQIYPSTNTEAHLDLTVKGKTVMSVYTRLNPVKLVVHVPYPNGRPESNGMGLLQLRCVGNNELRSIGRI